MQPPHTTKSDANQWVSEPKQKRTRERLDRIYAAADALFDAQGFEYTSLREVAAAVPCSMSAIYDRFESKDALLLAMHERLRRRVLSGMPLLAPESPPENVTLQAWVRLAVDGACASIEHHRGLRRAVMERCISSELLANKERAYREELCGYFVRGLKHFACEVRHPDVDVAARRVYSTLTAVISQRYDTRLEPEGSGLTDAQFRGECVRMCLGYLQLPPDASEAD